jgi:two-component system phosphate regulon response regulator PhoB
MGLGMPRVLVIEDDPDVRELLQGALASAGYEVRTATGGLEGLRLAKERWPDVVLLDLMLPDIGGTTVCRQLKFDPATSASRVIIVSARREEIDRVVGFELGADDYVVKPFSLRELMLRVRAVMGHTREAPAPNIIICGALRLDPEGHRVWVGEDEVVLTPLQFKLLLTLYSRRGRVQSRATLLADVWGTEPDLETRAMDTLVKRLRQKLGTAATYIQSVRGEGYQFSADSEV